MVRVIEMHDDGIVKAMLMSGSSDEIVTANVDLVVLRAM